MAFRFRLEKVARYRQRLVDEHARTAAAAGRVVAGLQARIAAVDEDLARHRIGPTDPGSGGLNVQGLLGRTMWIEHLEGMRADFGRELEIARLEWEAHRETLNAAWRDLEVLNRLREKQKAEWEAEERRREGQALDEIGQIRADRQRRSKVAS